MRSGHHASMSESHQPRRILLGQIGSAHGIRGEVVVRTYTGAPEAIASYGPLTDATGKKSWKLRVVRVSDKGVVARVEGVTDRNGAEALRGQELYVARAKLPVPDAAEYYHADLIGLAAVTVDGAEFGRIVALQNFGAGDLLEIQLSGQTVTEFVPFTNACVPEVDIAAGRVTVVPPVMTGEGPENDGLAENEGDDQPN